MLTLGWLFLGVGGYSIEVKDCSIKVKDFSITFLLNYVTVLLE